MTSEQFRRLALALDGAKESAHHNHPDFRVGGRVFATLGYPKPGYAMVKLTPDEQKFFAGAHPGAFIPVKGVWGNRGATNVVLRRARVRPVSEALTIAWELTKQV
jgi:hypothetical protein